VNPSHQFKSINNLTIPNPSALKTEINKNPPLPSNSGKGGFKIYPFSK
jgi:hypothetical protein